MFILIVVTVRHRKATPLTHASFLRLTAFRFLTGLRLPGINTENYKGDFLNMPVFIGTSDPDPHVPVERVNASAAVLENMHAAVTKKIYKNMGHTITQEEINLVNGIIFNTTKT